MLTRMARLLTRMARMLTRMTRWLAGSHIVLVDCWSSVSLGELFFTITSNFANAIPLLLSLTISFKTLSNFRLVFGSLDI